MTMKKWPLLVHWSAAGGESSGAVHRTLLINFHQEASSLFLLPRILWRRIPDDFGVVFFPEPKIGLILKNGLSSSSLLILWVDRVSSLSLIGARRSPAHAVREICPEEGRIP